MIDKVKISVFELNAIIDLIGHLSEEEIAKLIGEKKARLLNEFYFSRRVEAYYLFEDIKKVGGKPNVSDL